MKFIIDRIRIINDPGPKPVDQLEWTWFEPESRQGARVDLSENNHRTSLSIDKEVLPPTHKAAETGRHFEHMALNKKRKFTI